MERQFPDGSSGVAQTRNRILFHLLGDKYLDRVQLTIHSSLDLFIQRKMALDRLQVNFSHYFAVLLVSTACLSNVPELIDLYSEI